MAKSIEEIMEFALELSNDQRTILAARITESVESEEAGSPSQEWMEVARRRAEEMRSGTVRGVPVEVAMAKARAAINR